MSRFGNGCGRLWRKRKFPLHHVPCVFNWWEIWGFCWPGQLLYTTKSMLRRSSLMWTCVVLWKMHTTFLLKKWQWHWVNNLCNVAGTAYFTLTVICNWCPPPHHEAWGGPVCCRQMHSGRWCSPGLRHTCVCPSLAYIQKILSSLKTRECHFTVQSTLSQHQSSCAWWCRGVSGSLARGPSDLSAAANRLFRMVLGDTTGATWARISFLGAVRRPPFIV